jgi:hypothetical protein
MLLIREVLTAKPGQASKLAKLFKKVFGSDPNPENVFVRPTVCVTGGWGETGLDTDSCQSSEQSPKNAHSPSVRCTLCWAVHRARERTSSPH